jgi:DNA-binding CsgD family transcriptional regulator
MGTKPQELLTVRKTSAARRNREIAIAVADRCATAPTPSNLTPVLPGRFSGTDRNLAKASAPAHEPTRATDFAINLPMPSEGRLRKLFDLTPAEARLAQRLACGDSVEEVAQILHIKMTTARTQLAAIFAKTDTRRQAKLVAILSRIAHLENAMPSATDAVENCSPVSRARVAI